MMSSEQTETEVFGLFPNKQHLPQLPRLYHFCFLILNQVGGKKVVFLQKRAAPHYLITVICHSRKWRNETSV